MNEFFNVNVQKYVEERSFFIKRPASLNNPKNNSVMFVTKGFMDKAISLKSVKECLVFWPHDIEVPIDIMKLHAIVLCEDPHLDYCKFFQSNNLTNHPKLSEFEIINGAYIVKGAIISESAMIFPGAYIDAEVKVGNNVIIGSGTRVMGRVEIGDNVVIRENSVIGADGLSTDRDENGKAVTMPQFGGVRLGNNVQIGANTIIGRGAIDDTVIEEGSKIDNSCFISHNVHIGADTFVVGESIMFGSSSTGSQVYISGNSTIRNGIHIGSKAIVGMGSVVTKSIPDGAVACGNPAKTR